MTTLNLNVLKQAIRGEIAAFRTNARMQPAGGKGDKIFPPTYAVGDRDPTKYAVEKRRVDGASVDCVLIDSVASQANRMELALLGAWERGELDFPMVSVDFSDHDDLADIGRITALEAPHRIADAIFRDSELEGTAFRMSNVGRAYTEASPKNATAVYQYCPTALIFGVWDSTGPKGGLGAKFARAVSSEIVGVGVERGVKTASRIDPLAIESHVKIYQDKNAATTWTTDETLAALDKKKAPVLFTPGTSKDGGRASVINHGNIAPSIEKQAGGVTFDYALQTTVISIPALRRLRFPYTPDGQPVDRTNRGRIELAAQTVLAALSIAALAYTRVDGFDLRSRCALVPEGPLQIEAVPADGGATTSYTVTARDAAQLVKDAAAFAASEGIAWHQGELKLTPAERLVGLIRKSRVLSADRPAGDEEGA